VVRVVIIITIIRFIVRVTMRCIIRIQRDLELSEIGSGSGGHRHNDVRRTDIDDVSVAPDAMI
jgi:hypothetical protein